MAGIFLSPDSVQGNPQGLDPYTYVGGNPETATDPTGHGPCEEEELICQGAKAAAKAVAFVVAGIVGLAIAAIETAGFAWNHHSSPPNGLKPQPAPTPTSSHALDGIGVAGIQSAAQTAQNAVHLADMQAITQGIMQGAIQSAEDAIQAAEGGVQQAGVGASGGEVGGVGGAGEPPRRPPTNVTPPPPHEGDNCEEGGTTSSSRPTLTNGMTMHTNDALDAAHDFLGPGYSDVGNGRFVSADGLRQVRMGDSDILGWHGGGPHMNFEMLEPNPLRPGRLWIPPGNNCHIFLDDSL